MSIVWRPIPGYEGLYEASSDGQIRSLPHNVIGSDGMPKRFNGVVLKPASTKQGPVVGLSRSGSRKTHSVARLVLAAFVGPCPDGQECVYRDSDPSNTHLDNLLWGNGRRRTFFALIEHFWKRVDRSGECWLWTGEINNMGYGVYNLYHRDKRERALAHRVSAAMAGMAVADGDVVLHHCDIPRCVRPDHLSIGTQLDNIRDAKVKGRMDLSGLSALTQKNCRNCGAEFMGRPSHRYCDEHGWKKRSA